MLKELLVNTVSALCLYIVFGGYIVAIFNGKLPFMHNKEPARMCAVFQDGTTCGSDSILSIDAYREMTGKFLKW